MKIKALYLAAGMTGLMSLAGSAHASPSGSPINLNDVSMNVQIGNTAFNNIALNWEPIKGGTSYALTGGPIKLSLEDGSSFTIGDASFDPDPVMFFSASATNNGSNPLAYTFSFNTPLSPTLNGNINSHAEMGVSLTDGLNDGASVKPLVGNNYMLKSYDLYSNGDSVSKNVDIGTAFTIPSGTQTTSYSADSTLFCGQACVNMSSILTFTLTGQDSVGFSGKVVQSPVPVPGAVWLFGSAVAGLIGVQRRQRLIS